MFHLLSICSNRIVQLLFVGLLGLAFTIFDVKAQDDLKNPEQRSPVLLNVSQLPNALRIHEKVISGGMPEGEVAFEQLAKLGIQTIISVDGAKPDVEMARRFHMRYIHLPHGYDGIPEQRGHELAKAVLELKGSIYIHCHHGKHRSPVAAVVACVESGFIDPAMSMQVLKTAGTNPNYRGLYQTASEAKPLPIDQLSELQVDYQEVAEIPEVAEAMVNLEHRYDLLKKEDVSSWGKLSSQHETLAHEALLLREHFREMQRMESVKRESKEYQQMIQESEQESQSIENLLRGWSIESNAKCVEKLRESMQRLGKTCASCHSSYRDVPLREKTTTSQERK